MKKAKEVAIVLISAITIFALAIGGLILPDNEFSVRERRYLATAPKLSANNVLSGKFMDDTESYLADQFVGRNIFLKLKSAIKRHILLQNDDEGYYKKEGHIGKLEYPLNQGRLDRNLNALKKVYETYLTDTDRLYLTIIPDKNYFLTADGSHPYLDYEALVSQVQKTLDFATYIDIFPFLDINDYYCTDQHWKQEDLEEVAYILCQTMGTTPTSGLTPHTTDTDFYGTYYSQSGIDSAPDKICYMDGDALKNFKVISHDSNPPKEIAFYDFEKLQGIDGYDFFLSNGGTVTTIESKGSDNATGRKLIIFRDSFTTGLVPLICGDYQKITLVDLRYIDYMQLKDMVDFEDSDVLFCYSTLTLNNTISR